jgi:hypothetical protein
MSFVRNASMALSRINCILSSTAILFRILVTHQLCHCFCCLCINRSYHPSNPWSFAWCTFQHDMLHPTPILANFELIHQPKLGTHWLQCSPQELLPQLWRLWSWQWSPIVKVYNPAGLEQWAVAGPFTIKQVHVNGTFMIQCVPNIYEWINIYQVHPCTLV